MTSGIMKCCVVLALFGSLPACNLISHPSHQQAAITAYVVRTIDDPDSYQALWWSTPLIVSKAEKAQMDRRAMARANAAAARQAQAVALPAELTTAPTWLRTTSSGLTTATLVDRRRFLGPAGARDSLRSIFRHLSVQRDTSRYGYLIAHGYSARNSTGKPFRDSALFLVDVEANVTRWAALKKGGT